MFLWNVRHIFVISMSFFTNTGFPAALTDRN